MANAVNHNRVWEPCCEHMFYMTRPAKDNLNASSGNNTIVRVPPSLPTFFKLAKRRLLTPAPQGWWET